MPRGFSWSVLLNVSYHKIHEYIWFRGRDLNGFRDIKTFMKMERGVPRHATGRPSCQCN